jgi:hypothetical protein
MEPFVSSQTSSFYMENIIMNFKTWCHNSFGISTINQGKITSWTFIPFSQMPSNQTTAYLKAHGGNFTQKNGVSGVAFTDNDYGQFKQYLINSDSVKWLLDNGININQKSELRSQPPYYFTFDSQHHKNQFIRQFWQFNQISSIDPLKPRKGSNSVMVASNKILDSLYMLYYQDINKFPSSRESIVSIESQLERLKQLRQTIISSHLEKRLDQAHTLSLDYSNSIGHQIYEASSAYALSLNVFAELNKDNLSDEQYLAFNYASQLIAGYDGKGNLKQGLKTDSNFVHYLTRNLYKKSRKQFYAIHGRRPLLSELDGSILSLIDFNANSLLFGNDKVYLGKGKSFKANRFLPDDMMRSETDEIILQSGGMINHSAMFRLIKVAVDSRGNQVQPNQMPHHFNYYKIETNLGAGCHQVDWTNKTCTGTYVTQIEPMVKINDTWQKSNVNPSTDPNAYQHQINDTLLNLIKTERFLRCYRQPQQGPNGEGCSSAGSFEAREWTRLNTIKNKLSGTHIKGKFHFYPKTEYGVIISRAVKNQLGYLQESGSCTIFSIKQLVSSIIGSELSSLHSHFLQNTNGFGTLAAIDNKIYTLENQLRLYKNNLRLAQAKHTMKYNHSSFFFTNKAAEFFQVSMAIKECLDVSFPGISEDNKPMLFEIRDNSKKFSFKSAESAKDFAKFLETKCNITKESQKGVRKSIARDGKYFVVYMSQMQYETLFKQHVFHIQEDIASNVVHFNKQ